MISIRLWIVDEGNDDIANEGEAMSSSAVKRLLS
jgi:hypothetical protein